MSATYRLLCSSLLAVLPACVAGPRGTLTLVESYPVETDLDHADLPQTADVWLELIDGAQRSIDIASFYASEGPALEPVLRSLEAAAARGVDVRLLVSAVFRDTYPEILERFEAVPGILVRVVDYRDLTGGVMHGKYMIVDGEQSFVGSANLDWRALEHIQELGVHIGHPYFAQVLGVAFDADWGVAGGELTATPEAISEQAALYISATSVQLERMEVQLDEAQAVHGPKRTTLITPTLSPPGLLPGSSLWELEVLMRWIDQAEESVSVQVLTYHAAYRDGRAFNDLDEALRRAAERGVQVRLIVSDWSKRDGIVQGLQSLARVPGIDVRFMVIPDASTGFVPFARVVHAKYAVFDRERAWLGSSNWEGDYFYSGRNVGLLMGGEAIGGRLEAYFDRNWTSPYAEVVDPTVRYEPRRRD